MNPSSLNPDPIRLGSAQTKPRLAKLRKHTASSKAPKSKLFPESGNIDYGFNPFRPNSDISVPELGSSFQAKLNFGDGGNEAFVFGAKTGNVCGFVENKVLDDMRKLKIENLDPGNEGESSRLEEDIRKLKIGDSVFVDSPENQNVSLFGESVGRELPNELKKLDIKDHKDPEISRTNDSADDIITSVHRNTNEGDTSMPGSSAEMFPGKTESMLSIEMERLRLAKEVGDAPCEGETSFNSCSGVNSLFPPKDFIFQTPKISNPSGSIFTGAVGKKMEFNARREPTKDARLKKSRGKLKKPVPVKEDFVSSVNTSFQENQEDSFESYSPMDISPYRESMIDNEEVQRDSRNTSVELEESFIESLSTTAIESQMKEDTHIAAVERLDIDDEDAKFAKTKVEECQFGTSGSFDADVPRDDYDSEAETESFVTADVQFDYDSSCDTFVTAADTEVCSCSKTQTEMLESSCGPTSEDVGRTKTNFTFAAATSIHSQSSTSTRHQKKENRYRVSHELYSSSPTSKIQQSSPSMQFFQSSKSSSLLSPKWSQKGDLPTPFPKRANKAEAVKDSEIKQESSVIPTASLAAQEACDKWRLRGNQAYASGDMLRAEDYYSQGVNCISQNEKSKSCLRALMLCYSNRAATRMSLGRVREALGDCRRAAVIDPKFLRVQVRAANCYLALGDVGNASQHFTACFQSGNDSCVDPKLALEASEGLEKSQRVLECMKQSAELMQQRNLNAENALRVISEALTLSIYSEKLLELKAEALFTLGKYEELIRLCEQTLASAETNHAAVSADDASDMESSDAQKDVLRLWRWRLIIKSYFCLGRLEDVLDFLNKQEESAKIRKTTLESLPLIGTIRELVRNKGAGNEAFKSGNYAEAIEHYTTALSSTVESRPFAAVCFCNRAAAYKAIGQVVDAIADCCIAIALDGNYLKAISRRASLFEMIRDYDQAAKDLERVSSLLTKHVEEKAGQFDPTDELNGWNELRHVQQWKYATEEHAKQEIPLNLYLILGVDPSVAAAEIKKAYRKAALKHHPDKACQFFARSENIDDGLWKEVLQEVHKDADRLFKMIGEAYAILSDPIKRSQYDIDEEMRNAQRRGFGGPRVHTDKSAQGRENSSSRRHQWRDVWRPYGNNFQSRGSDTNYRSSRY